MTARQKMAQQEQTAAQRDASKSPGAKEGGPAPLMVFQF